MGKSGNGVDQVKKRREREEHNVPKFQNKGFCFLLIGGNVRFGGW
jgi:hypothetical protein